MSGSIVTRRGHCNVAWPCFLALLALTSTASAQSSPPPSDSPPPSPSREDQAPALTAGAQPSAPPAPPYRPLVLTRPAISTKTRQWYGWQNLIGFGISDMLIALGVAAGAASGKPDGIPMPTLFVSGTGLAGQVFSGPIIHWAHGHVGRGFLSLGLNGALPFLGAGVGYFAGASDPSTAFVGFFSGLLTGVAIGRVVDVAVLAYEDVDERSTEMGAPGGWASAVTVVPILGRETTGVGVAGLF